MTARWYVVRVQPNKETQAVIHLNNQGYVTYLPRYKKQRRHARKVEIVLRPLFPGYLFVKLDVEVQAWRAINSTVGVVGVVHFGSELPFVSDEFVDAIFECEDEQGIVSLSPVGVKVGDSVRVREGALEDSIGILTKMQDNKRVTMLLNVLGRGFE